MADHLGSLSCPFPVRNDCRHDCAKLARWIVLNEQLPEGPKHSRIASFAANVLVAVSCFVDVGCVSLPDGVLGARGAIESSFGSMAAELLCAGGIGREREFRITSSHAVTVRVISR